MVRVDTKRGRDALAPRREPYFHKLSKGRYVGLRKLTDGCSTWIARYRDDHGTQHYQALGDLSETFEFDQAKEAAKRWIGEVEQGVTHRHEDGRLVTVASVCIAYVRALRAEGRMNAAHDAHMRFRRTVYGTVADEEFAPTPLVASQMRASKAAKAVKARADSLGKWSATPHEVAYLPVSKLRAPILKKWHVDLVAAGLSKAAANRT